MRSTAAANSKIFTMLSGMAIRSISTAKPAIKRTAEWPSPQTVADRMDLRRLLLLHTRAVIAKMWSGSRECTKPNANPVRSMKAMERSMMTSSTK